MVLVTMAASACSVEGGSPEATEASESSSVDTTGVVVSPESDGPEDRPIEEEIASSVVIDQCEWRDGLPSPGYIVGGTFDISDDSLESVAVGFQAVVDGVIFSTGSEAIVGSPPVGTHGFSRRSVQVPDSDGSLAAECSVNRVRVTVGGDSFETDQTIIAEQIAATVQIDGCEWREANPESQYRITGTLDVPEGGLSSVSPQFHVVVDGVIYTGGNATISSPQVGTHGFEGSVQVPGSDGSLAAECSAGDVIVF